jgi:hypothetical protein
MATPALPQYVWLVVMGAFGRLVEHPTVDLVGTECSLQQVSN